MVEGVLVFNGNYYNVMFNCFEIDRNDTFKVQCVQGRHRETNEESYDISLDFRATRETDVLRLSNELKVLKDRDITIDVDSTKSYRLLTANILNYSEDIDSGGARCYQTTLTCRRVENHIKSIQKSLTATQEFLHETTNPI